MVGVVFTLPGRVVGIVSNTGSRNVKHLSKINLNSIAIESDVGELTSDGESYV